MNIYSSSPQITVNNEEPNELARGIAELLFLIIGVFMLAFASFIYELYPTTSVIIAGLVAIIFIVYFGAAAALKVIELINTLKKRN